MKIAWRDSIKVNALAGLDINSPIDPMAGKGPNRPDRGTNYESRLQRRLWSDASALAAVRSLGLRDSTIRRFRLGLKEPYLSSTTGLVTERALCFPIFNIDGTRSSRWGYSNLAGVTRNPIHPVCWGAGQPRPYYSRIATRHSKLLVLGNILDLWLVSQVLGEAYSSVLIVCPTHPGIPEAWRESAYWLDWARIVLGVRADADGHEIADAVTSHCGMKSMWCRPPDEEGWADFIRSGASSKEILKLIDESAVWAPIEPEVEHSDPIVGNFEANPVPIEGAFINGMLHYPTTYEHRSIEENSGRLVQCYVTRVVRSDGHILDIKLLPAPRGTANIDRVWSMSDGTRIASPPAKGRFGSWSQVSIKEFLSNRSTGRPVCKYSSSQLEQRIEEILKSGVWLPHDDDYALIALFILGTFVHRVFEAMPILLVNGPKGSGKSELGQIIATTACNGVMAGRISAAGLMRLLSESRGTVIFDDLESVSNRGYDDISQILKVSYKAVTAKRITPGRDGRVEVLDFYSPKVISNIGGCDSVLLARCLVVETLPIPLGRNLPVFGGIEHERLRDECHVWAMDCVAHVKDSYQRLALDTNTRSDEIAAPLRALARVCGSTAITARLERALSRPKPESAERPEVVLEHAIDKIVDDGFTIDFSMPHLQLEIALQNGDGIRQPSPESIGRLLSERGRIALSSAPNRRRLNGMPVRVYKHFNTESEASKDGRDPLSFCRDNACSDCRYIHVCDTVLPGMRERKRPSRLRG